MALTKFNLQSLEKIGHGSVVEAFNQALKRAAMDCEDNPHDDQKRVITLACELVPVCESDAGACDEVNAKFHIREKLPTRRSRKYSMALRRDGMLVFNVDSEDDVNQKTLLDDED